MVPIVIDISPLGRVAGMHRDEFNLKFLGKQTITRASEITHNPETQQWEIRVPPDEFASARIPSGAWPVIKSCGTFPSYNKARDFEVDWMNSCRIAGFKPGSQKGQRLAGLLRRENYTKDGRRKQVTTRARPLRSAGGDPSEPGHPENPRSHY